MTRRNLIKVKLEKNVYLMNVAQLFFCSFSSKRVRCTFLFMSLKFLYLSSFEMNEGRDDDEEKEKRERV